MKHCTIGVALLSSVFVLSSTGRAQDKIYTGAKMPAEGKITKESPAGVTYSPKGGKPASSSIPAGQIIQIDYHIKDEDKYGSTIDWNSANNALRRAREATDPKKRKDDIEKALEKYQMLALAPKLADDKALKRQVEFNLAEIQTMQIEGDPKKLDAAIEALKKFKTDYGDGWQLVRATKMLVRLLEQKGDEAGAQTAYTELADNEAAPKEVRQEFGMLVVRDLLRKGKHADAATRAKALDAVIGADDPQRVRLNVYLAACDIAARKFDGVEDGLKKVLESSADDSVKAMARNTLGDFYRAQNKGDKAFWEYLWVDVHYNQDREELAQALYHLSHLFAEVRQDKVRAKECLERVCDEGQFGGLEYHIKAKAERDSGGK